MDQNPEPHGTFGHTALPPQYGLAAMKQITDMAIGHMFAEPDWNGYEPAFVDTYVDGTMLLNPDWGVRRWMARGLLM